MPVPIEKKDRGIERALLSDVPAIAALARQHTQELGFLPDVVIEEAVYNARLLIHRETGSFIIFRIRRDGVSTVGVICVHWIHRKKGVGRLLIESVPRPIVLKCPAFLPSNDFYEHMGFVWQGFEQEGVRPVNVWRLD